MVRRKTRDTDQPPNRGASESFGVLLPPGIAPVVAPPMPPTPVPAEALPWTVSSWHGLPQWRCAQCPWDTLEGEEAMIAHIKAHHGPAIQAQPIVQAYDARGNPLEG